MGEGEREKGEGGSGKEREEGWVGFFTGLGTEKEEEIGCPESQTGRAKKRGGVRSIKPRDEFPPVI